MKKRGVFTILISLVLLTAAAVGLALQASLAIWERSNDATLDLIPEELPNPSAGFFVYAAVGESGEFLTPAEFADENAVILGAAIVGYGGSLAAELRFPSEYAFIGGESAYPVIRLAACPDGVYTEHMGEIITNGADYNFSGNLIVTHLIIPPSVSSVGTGAFKNMTRLSSVVFETASAPVTVGDYSFMGCASLEVVRYGRSLLGAEGGELSHLSNAFLQITPPPAFEEIE